MNSPKEIGAHKTQCLFFNLFKAFDYIENSNNSDIFYFPLLLCFNVFALILLCCFVLCTLLLFAVGVCWWRHGHLDHNRARLGGIGGGTVGIERWRISGWHSTIKSANSTLFSKIMFPVLTWASTKLWCKTIIAGLSRASVNFSRSQANWIFSRYPAAECVGQEESKIIIRCCLMST